MEINVEYKDRYLKYKNKYLQLQRQIQQNGGRMIGGDGLAREIAICLVVATDHPEELDDILSFNIYQQLLRDGLIDELKFLVNIKIKMNNYYNSIDAFQNMFPGEEKKFVNGVLTVSKYFKIYDYEKVKANALAPAAQSALFLAIQGPITKPKFNAKMEGSQTYTQLMGQHPDYMIVQGMNFNVTNGSAPQISKEVTNVPFIDKLVATTTGGPNGTTGVHLGKFDTPRLWSGFSNGYNGEIKKAAINFWAPKVLSTSMPVQILAGFPTMTPKQFWAVSTQPWWQTSVSYPPEAANGSGEMDMNTSQSRQEHNTNMVAVEHILEQICGGRKHMGGLNFTGMLDTNASSVKNFKIAVQGQGKIISDELYKEMIRVGSILVGAYINHYGEPNYAEGDINFVISAYRAASLLVARFAFNDIPLDITGKDHVETILANMPAKLLLITGDPEGANSLATLPQLNTETNQIRDPHNLVVNNESKLISILKEGVDLSKFNHCGDAGLALMVTDSIPIIRAKSLAEVRSEMETDISTKYSDPEASARLMANISSLAQNAATEPDMPFREGPIDEGMILKRSNQPTSEEIAARRAAEAAQVAQDAAAPTGLEALAPAPGGGFNPRLINM